MTTYLIVLFNFKSDASVTDYERLAVAPDIPVMRGVTSIDRYDVFKSVEVRNAKVAPPYQYVELIAINDMDLFGKEFATETMRAVAAELWGFADAPPFVLSERLSD